jgi:hypothetical protein
MRTRFPQPEQRECPGSVPGHVNSSLFPTIARDFGCSINYGTHLPVEQGEDTVSHTRDSLNEFKPGESAVADAAPESNDHPVRVIGRRLEVARKRRNWTYRQMATQTGVRSSTLHYWIWRRRRTWAYYELKKLVETLGESWTDEWERLWRRSAEAGPRGSAERPASG